MKKLLGCLLCVMLLVFGISGSVAALTVPGNYQYLGGGPGIDNLVNVQAIEPSIVANFGEEITTPAAWAGTWDASGGMGYLYMSVKAASGIGSAGGGWALYYLGDYQTSGWFSTVKSISLGGVDYSGWEDLGGGHNMSHLRLWNGMSVPEPATMLLLGSGIFGLAIFGRRRFKK